MAWSTILIAIGAACVLASVVWLMIERRSIPYVYAQLDSGSEPRVIYATLLGVAGIMVLVFGTVGIAFAKG